MKIVIAFCIVVATITAWAADAGPIVTATGASENRSSASALRDAPSRAAEDRGGCFGQTGGSALPHQVGPRRRRDGEVYRATDTKLGRDVAVKVLPADMAASAERRERFQREARVLAALDNPHIVTIHSVEEASGVHFLTMELVDGESLDRLILGRGLPIERILEIATAVAEGLSAAHEKGIIHRDLVPDVSVPGAPECGRLAGDRPCALSRSRSRGQRENIRRPASGHAQLTDVGSGYQLWSERFDRNAQDIFAVQDEIAAGVVEAVRVRARL